MHGDDTAARAHAAIDDGLPSALTKISVLVVDDQANMVRMIRRVLRELGFADISEAHDGQAALTILEARPHGLIISDLRMEPMDGLALLRAVRGHEQLASVPFIMLTGVGDRDRIIAAKEAGVSDYMVKPFTIQTLKRKLEKLLGSHQPSETTAGLRND
jgi:two-component system, chemotaxis family, chemotaxis protein CheY